MKGIITTFIIILLAATNYAQDSQRAPGNDDFFKTEAVRGLIGNNDNATLLFVGDAIERDSVVNSKVEGLWEKLDAKADFVIVFSEEMKKAVSSVSSSEVVLANGTYEDYFVKTWRSMKKWFIIEFNFGKGGSFTASNEAIDLVTDRD
jgi:hypothetical protein